MAGGGLVSRGSHARGAVGGKAGDALAGGEIGGSEWVLALAAATEDGTVSVSTLGDTGYPRVARESAFSDAGVCKSDTECPCVEAGGSAEASTKGWRRLRQRSY